VTNGRKTRALSCNTKRNYESNTHTKPHKSGNRSSVSPSNYVTSDKRASNPACSNLRTKCPQLSLHNVLWRSRVKVLYFRTYPPLDTTGHTRGHRVTRMDTSDCDVHVHNTYIYKYNFHLDIYICVLLGVSSCSSFYLSLSVLEKWWVLWSNASQPQYPCGLKVVIHKWASTY
jgi:hypothetical protein